MFSENWVKGWQHHVLSSKGEVVPYVTFRHFGKVDTSGESTFLG